MKVSGFSFCRNAVLYDYPVVESIRSILPIVDEFVVNVGRCDDGTLDLIHDRQNGPDGLHDRIVVEDGVPAKGKPADLHARPISIRSV